MVVEPAVFSGGCCKERETVGGDMRKKEGYRKGVIYRGMDCYFFYRFLLRLIYFLFHLGESVSGYLSLKIIMES